MPAARPKTLSIFYGYPPELIARWCGIAVSSARLYKSGARKPSRTVLRLFTLHRDARVLGPEWQGFKVEGGLISDPQGCTLTRGQLEAYSLILQFAAELARQSPQGQARYQALLRALA